MAPLCALGRPATPPSPVSPTARAAGPSPGTRSGQVLQLAALGSYPQRSGDPVVRAFSHTPGRLCISNLTDSSTLFALGRLKINRRIFWGSLYFCDFFSSSAVAIKLATPFNLLLLIEIVLSKIFKLRLHLRSFFRRLPSVLLLSPRRHPRDCVCALPLERERSPSLSSRKLCTRAHLLCLQSGDTCCFFADIIKQSSPSP